MKPVEHDPEQIRRFQSWLREEMRVRSWTKAELARQLGIHQTVVGRWLRTVGDVAFRRPSLDSAEELARVLGYSVDRVLREIGLKLYADDDLTDLQRETLALIRLLPSDQLRFVHQQLKALVDAEVQRQAAAKRGDRAAEAAESTTNGSHASVP